MSAQTRHDPLVVYMPVVHGGRARGFAKSLSRVGMRMMVTGPTASHSIHYDNRFKTERAAEVFGTNVFATEGEEIFDNPPDVIVVGREDNLDSSISLKRQLGKVKPVAIVGYSGVFQSRFQYKKLDGLIATDKASRAVARYSGVPALKYFPEFNFDGWPYVPEPSQDRVVLRSFIRNYQARFPISHALHEECRARLAAEFGDRVIVENHEDAKAAEVKTLIAESTASLHIKDEEGFGWSMLESLSTGRPVIWQSGLSRSMAFLDWIPDAGAPFSFTSPDDLVALVRRFLNEPEWRVAVQWDAAETVRARFDAEGNAAALGDFLMAIVTTTKLRWAPWRPLGKRKEIQAYAPTLDPPFCRTTSWSPSRGSRPTRSRGCSRVGRPKGHGSVVAAVPSKVLDCRFRRPRAEMVIRF